MGDMSPCTIISVPQYFFSLLRGTLYAELGSMVALPNSSMCRKLSSIMVTTRSQSAAIEKKRKLKDEERKLMNLFKSGMKCSKPTGAMMSFALKKYKPKHWTPRLYIFVSTDQNSTRMVLMKPIQIPHLHTDSPLVFYLTQGLLSFQTCLGVVYRFIVCLPQVGARWYPDN